MRNPLRRLRFLPWMPLLLTAVLTVFWVSVLELLLVLGYERSTLIQQSLDFLFAPPLGLIVEFALNVGVGALAVFFLEAVYPNVVINIATLWALVLCVLVMVVARSILPLPVKLVTPNEILLVGATLGVFLKGKPYWR